MLIVKRNTLQLLLRTDAVLSNDMVSSIITKHYNFCIKQHTEMLHLIQTNHLGLINCAVFLGKCENHRQKFKSHVAKNETKVYLE